MPPVGFEPTISAGERPKTYALDRAATGTGLQEEFSRLNYKICIATDPVTVTGQFQSLLTAIPAFNILKLSLLAH